MKRLISLFMVMVLCISCLLLTGCGLTYEVVEVTATVTEKEYKSSYLQPYTTYINNQVHIQYRTVPAKYYVTVVYEDVVETFNNSSLYNKVEEGDSIEIYLYLGYDDEGVLKEKKLKLDK